MSFKPVWSTQKIPLNDADLNTSQIGIVVLIATMMVLVPALGWPNEELLQDTLKSMLVSLFVLSAAIVYFWNIRNQTINVKLHGLLWLPVSLMLYALGSTAWSHAYLGSVEAIRWFVFSLLVFLGMNTLTLPRIVYLAWGIHVGAVAASFWTALQFWFDFQFFPQGPNPGSTFVNRNFFAEFIVCTLPFSVLLSMRLKDKSTVFLIVFSLGFNITALLMTGTRSAILSLLLLFPLMIGIVFLFRNGVISKGWRPGHCISLAALLLVTVLALGSLETRNTNLLSISPETTALKRTVSRTAQLMDPLEYTQGSFSLRTTMWLATKRMIAANPVMGVGAGAWEAHIPIYQAAGSQLEIDYYAHNEFLQLGAEYGIVGWLFIASLLLYLARAIYHTWPNPRNETNQEMPIRALVLSTLFVLFIVSNAGFPWHMAGTGVLFALSLAVLAASDIRLYGGRTTTSFTLFWRREYSLFALALSFTLFVVAAYISHLAVECESKLIRAVKTAATITQSGRPHDPRWGRAKADMLELTRQSIAINPHYRKLTPIVADALAGWGDWSNAIWIWDSVLKSRPNVVGMISNVAKGHLQVGNFSLAQEYLNRAKAIQPTAASLATLEVMLWSRTGRELEAVQRSKELLRNGVVDRDLVQTGFFLGTRHGNAELAIQALERGIETWPGRAVDGWLKLGAIYASAEAKDEHKAVESFRAALDAAPALYKPAVLAKIPPAYRERVQ